MHCNLIQPRKEQSTETCYKVEIFCNITETSYKRSYMFILNTENKLGVVEHTFNSRIQKVEAG